jgi:hypothetical protein
VDFSVLTWFLAFSLNNCLNPVIRALLENAACPQKLSYPFLSHTPLRKELYLLLLSCVLLSKVTVIKLARQVFALYARDLICGCETSLLITQITNVKGKQEFKGS